MVPPRSDRISRVPPYSRTNLLSTRTGLSPTMARLSKRFRFLQIGHWPGPRSLATTNGVSVDVLSYGYLDVSVPRVCFIPLCIQGMIPFIDTWKPQPQPSIARECNSDFPSIKGGFPHSEIRGSKLIRSSPRLFAACHVLHRLLAPRHPPNALLTLDQLAHGQTPVNYNLICSC